MDKAVQPPSVCNPPPESTRLFAGLHTMPKPKRWRLIGADTPTTGKNNVLFTQSSRVAETVVRAVSFLVWNWAYV